MSHVCEVCGSERSRTLFQAHDRVYGRPGSYAVVQCPTCGLIWLRPRPDQPKEDYPEDYAPYLGQEASTGIASGPGQQGGLQRKVNLIVRHAKAPLVDLGCAGGDFLVALQDHFAGSLLGMDFCETAVRRARQRSRSLLWVGHAHALPLRNGSIGTVAMWHVLEHVSRPLDTLCEIGRVLWSDGVLAMACPMADSWEARLFGQFWAGYDVPRHLFAFSRTTLPLLLQRAGFEAAEASHVVLGYSSARLSTALWLQSFAHLRTRPRLVRATAAVLGAGLTLAFELLSSLLGNHRAVGVYVARKVAQLTVNSPCSDRL